MKKNIAQTRLGILSPNFCLGIADIMSAQADVQLKDFKSLFSLDGKVAVVTGGSRGLGLHAASG